MIREVQLSDAESICNLYNYYIEETIITFEDQLLQPSDIEERIWKTRLMMGYPYIVYEMDNQVVAYAYLEKWRSRPAYDISMETSIYVDKDFQGKGIGNRLYSELIRRGKELNLHSLIGVISLPNDVSRNLHRKLGFQLTGHIREAGRKFDKYIDIEYWQLILKSERD